jgi:uncharacterized protein with HEPN domain
MQPEAPDQAHLWDMLNYARAVAAEVEGKTYQTYQSDENWRLAIERRIEIVGEAASHVSEAFRQSHPEIPWRPIVAQRNVLAHGYGEIDDRRVWQVATVHIPALVGLLVPLVGEPPAP